MTYPRAGNIGGGGFMVIHSADRKEDIAIDYRETAPAATTRDIFLGSDGKPDIAKSRDSALGIGVPGTVAGLSVALDKYGSGKFSLADLVTPGIAIAANGAVITDDSADTLPDWHKRLAKWPSSAKIFSRADGTSLREGDTLVQTDLAATLSAIAEQGPRGFYEGPVAEKLVKAVRDAGGIMTLDDLKSYQPVIRTPVRGSYRGYDIVSMPQPSSGGVVLLETLNILEGFAMHDMAQGSAPSLHVMIEAMKRAYADRARYLGDPAFVNAPIATLIAKDYAAKQRLSIDLNKATPWTDALSAVPPREGSNTTHFSVVDSRGNAVSNTYTLNFSYGVGLVAEGTGVLLNNELDDFTAAPGASNAYGLVGFESNLPGPGKRPLSSMAPTIVLKDGKTGAGDGIAGRQPHHLHGAAGDRQRAGLRHGRRRRRRRTPAASSVAARRSTGRARICRRDARGAESHGARHRRAARPDLGQFHRGDAVRIAGRPRPAHARRGGGGAMRPCPGRGAAFFMPLRRAGTQPSIGAYASLAALRSAKIRER